MTDDRADELTRAGLIAAPARRPIPWDGPQTAADVLDRALEADSGREALVGRHERLDYATLERQVNRAAAALRRLGVGRGDRVAMSTGNHPPLVVAFLAIMRLGAIWAGLHHQLAGPEKRFLIGHVEASVLLADARAFEQVAPHRRELPALRHVIDAEPSRPSEWSGLLVAEDGDERPGVTVDPFAPAAISFTSGTTGYPKGAVHSQHNMLVVVARGGAVPPDVAAPDGAERRGVCLPLTLLNLMILGPLGSFAFGHTCVAVDRVDPVGLAEWILAERIGSLALVPTQLHDLLTHPDVDVAQLATFFRPGVGGADCPPAWRRQFADRGFPVGQGYGLTEAPTAVTVGLPDDPPGTSGRALPYVRVVAVDEADTELGPDEVGEVCIGPVHDGPFAHVYTPMLGYWNDADASARALRGGLLHTGDIGSVSAAGLLTIRDRKHDLILRGGANVYPAEVERVLAQDARVTASAVLGIPDDRLGESVAAAVELAPGASVTPDELRAHCAAELARYKVPDRIVVVDALPRTAMGKVLRRELRSLFAP
jgi:acyl-CoA synthetase (AMP-forming)/AMP-acid ligase II